MSLLKNISLFLLSKKESKKTNKQFFSWNQLSKIIIIAYDNQLSNVVDFINACKKDGIMVHVVIIYNGKPQQVPKPNFEHTIFDQKQFSFFDIPNEVSLKELSASNFDLLINLGDKEQIKALTLSKLVVSKCKISSFQNNIFDIIIDNNSADNVSDYLKQVIVYLNMIKTTHN